ncbi:unnamed protein product [Orchesella dallaii]|uniref:Transcription initiation factor TFIID subunit 1 n=1 Tax=Orchesella dallaii TaxID=48710 RepID=A0ABP1S0B5_9HEXA
MVSIKFPFQWSITRNDLTAVLGTFFRGKKPVERKVNGPKDLEEFEPFLSFENFELVYGKWEDEVIWDAEEERQKNKKPRIMTLNPNDENIILEMPADNCNDVKLMQPPTKVTNILKYKCQTHSNKTTKLLRQLGVFETPLHQDQAIAPYQFVDKDFANHPFNISNDEYYESRLAEYYQNSCASQYVLEHPTEVTKLKFPFIVTRLDTDELRNFHRPPIKKYFTGTDTSVRTWKIMSLTRHIQHKNKKIQAVISANNCEKIRQLMSNASDLSGRDSELLLIENCEEYPPLLSQVGMCSNIINYCYRSSMKIRNPASNPQSHDYGETKLVHGSPFLGLMNPGQVLTTLENKLYRCPIYLHSNSKTDFVLILSKNACFIREFDATFTAGQHIPLCEVPVPNSNKAKQFFRDFVMVFCYRKFLDCQAKPRFFMLDEVTTAFPSISGNTVRKWLKICADVRKDANNCVVVLKDEVLLPSVKELEAMVTPEKCCAYYSLLAGEQRLKDAGYSSEKCLFSEIDEFEDMNENEKDDFEGKLEDEVKNAPWNTTSAYLQARKGKCLLQITGPADPTGCGEGFSYVRLSKKAVTGKEHKQNVNGTDSDLRRLSVSGAKDFLKKIGISAVEIRKLSRWEIIDLVRTISTEKLRAGETGKLLTKYSRVKLPTVHYQESYRKECQRIFDLQNNVLSSNELLSSDAEVSGEDDTQETIEAMGRDIEQILNRNTPTHAGLNTYELEEIERLELQKMMLGDEKAKESNDDSKLNSVGLKKYIDGLSHPQTTSSNRVLKITRTFTAPPGKRNRRIEEIVKNPDVINAYIKIRTRNREETIRKFAQKLSLVDKKQLEERKQQMQENKRMSNQEWVAKEEQRRQKWKDNISDEYFPNLEARKKAEKMSRLLRRKCGACGSFGHFRTSKLCPVYVPLQIEKSCTKRQNTADVQGVCSLYDSKNNQGSVCVYSDSINSDASSISTTSEGDSSDLNSVSSDESEIVRVEGTKVVFRLSQNDLITNSQQLTSQEKTITLGHRGTRSRISQVDREQSDYLNKPFRTTAADRKTKM